MSDNVNPQASRRWLLKAGALTSGALALGLPGTAAAQEDGDDDDDGEFRSARMLTDEFNGGAVFRVISPALEDAPVVENPDALGDYSVRVIEYFNTNEESYLFVPANQQLQEGDLYVFDEGFDVTAFGDDDDDDAFGVDTDLVQIQYRPLGQEDFPFDLDEEDGFELGDEGGGEAAIRPGDFYTGALFRITSGPQGWLPQDVADSGYFTDYVTVHAEYLGTDDQFLFFPQEDADIETGRLYVMWDEFEFFDPGGNLIATDFDVVNEESIEVDEEYL